MSVSYTTVHQQQPQIMTAQYSQNPAVAVITQRPPNIVQGLHPGEKYKAAFLVVGVSNFLNAKYVCIYVLPVPSMLHPIGCRADIKSIASIPNFQCMFL